MASDMNSLAIEVMKGEIIILQGWLDLNMHSVPYVVVLAVLSRMKELRDLIALAEAAQS